MCQSHGLLVEVALSTKVGHLLYNHPLLGDVPETLRHGCHLVADHAV